MRILLAEDEQPLRDSFVRQLTRLGHEVLAYPDGDSLCDAIRSGTQADLIWSDLAMPGADGFEVMAVARTFQPHTPLLVVSGLADAEHLLRTLRGGAINFLPKPFQPSELLDILRRAESIRLSDRNRERSLRSISACDLKLRVPADLGVAAAVTALLLDHAKAFLSEAECHGLRLAIHEILLNSIEHGCLEITREEKLDALTNQHYAELVTARQHDPRLAAHIVDVRLLADATNGVEVELEDPGPGFDLSTLPDPSDAENLFLPSGRGIMLARLQVDDLSYASRGRVARLCIKNDPERGPPSGRMRPWQSGDDPVL
jgi:CheY-like chemotaxis protein